LGETTEEMMQILVRKADLDDIEELMKLMSPQDEENLDLLFDYPKLLTLFERSFLSVTILDQN
jgi:hypothetical protein